MSVPVFVRRFSVVRAGEAEVHDAHADARAFFARDHDVLGLDVAVDDAARVAVVEGVGDLDADVEDVAEPSGLVAKEPAEVRAPTSGITKKSEPSCRPKS